MMDTSQLLTVGFINIRGQTGLNLPKQLQIEQFLRNNNLDILHLQEANIEDDTFSECYLISSSYNIIVNNSQNKYGTASLVKTEFDVENLAMDKEGRVIIFEVGGVTCGNLYIHSGTDAASRSKRENYFSEVVPQLLINHKQHGFIGGDLNSIIDKNDATHNPESKISPAMKRLVGTFKWEDSFRVLHPSSKSFSRYYKHDRTGNGASRIDRCYHWGRILAKEAKYISLAFSDHFGLVISFSVPDQITKMLSPRSRPFFKTRPEVVEDTIFKERLKYSMEEWLVVKSQGVNTLIWWEKLVKPGIRKLAMARGKEMNKDRRRYLNLLLVRQAYLTSKIQKGIQSRLTELKHVHLLIEKWYDEECSKIALQSRTDDVQESEKIRIYHHEIHQKLIKKTAILKLDTEKGLLEGHQACASYLENSVADLLLHPAQLDSASQQTLLEEIEPVFTEADNKMLLAIPDKEEVKEIVWNSNQHAAPGTDGLTAHLYKQCWDVLGDSLTEVAQDVFQGQQPTPSQRTSLMVFGAKPKKQKSIQPKDKRKISLLNVDFKIMTGIDAKRMRKIMPHTVSPLQLVGGGDRRIHHGIALARDAIHAAGKSHYGCGILDTDLIAAFDWMVMSWVLKVLEKKGMCAEAIARAYNLYSENMSIVVVNNVLGRVIHNIRLSIRQGDKSSMEWFSYGIDPVITYLDRRLTGILIQSLPIQGPLPPPPCPPLPPQELRYKVIAYCDDVKPAITSMQEFVLVDKAMSLFENSSGCKMHRDPTAGKCKFLALGRWRGTLQQEDLPCNFFSLSDHLDMLGVTLKATYTGTRKANGDELQVRMKNVVGPWRAGKFMPLTMRPHSLNCYGFSKLWHRCTAMDLRIGDVSAINKYAKAWLYADLLEKPEELALYRQTKLGGLGLYHVQLRALAHLINSFLETACSPKFRRNLFHQTLFNFYVLEDNTSQPPDIPPYFKGDFFPAIKRIHASPLNVANISLKNIYRFLLEEITMTEDESGSQTLTPLRIELANPANQWDRSWEMARQNMLGPTLTTFLFKLLHQILPTAERVSRILPNQSHFCSRCKSSPPIVETLQHAMFDCDDSKASEVLLLGLKEVIPDLTPTKILTLNFDPPEDYSFPVVWSIAHFLSSLWQLRAEKKQVQLIKIRSDMEASCRLLRESRLHKTNDILTKIFRT